LKNKKVDFLGHSVYISFWVAKLHNC